MHHINDGSSNTRTLVANKIGAILSTACGTASIVRSRNMPFGFDIAANDDEKEFNDGALKKTHPCDKIANCVAQHRPIALASAILTRKWKTSLKKVARVKLRLKTKTKVTANEEAMELCKKRILMGEKCRALNLSGVLHYDKQGILLPED